MAGSLLLKHFAVVVGQFASKAALYQAGDKLVLNTGATFEAVKSKLKLKRNFQVNNNSVKDTIIFFQGWIAGNLI